MISKTVTKDAQDPSASAPPKTSTVSPLPLPPPNKILYETMVSIVPGLRQNKFHCHSPCHLPKMQELLLYIKSNLSL